jgi:NAD(P)-dependent dehydrogenase (short-subunit alcohol dehydrogenase family)
VVNGVRAFLPILLGQDSGVLVNTSSVFGLLGWPNQSAYCASKFAVRGFTESLRHELGGTGVRAVAVHPGGIRTNILRNARFHSDPMRRDLSHEDAATQFDALARTTPERAADIILAGVMAGKSRILVGPDAYVFDALVRLAPTRYFDVLAFLEPWVARLAR